MSWNVSINYSLNSLPPSPTCIRVLIERATQIILKDKRIKYALKDDWTIIGCTQRLKRRSWLNFENIIFLFNNHYHVHRIVCVEVNVEKTNNPLEQLVLHRSLDVLIGIHGAKVSITCCIYI